MTSINMLAALKAVEEYTGSKVIAASFSNKTFQINPPYHMDLADGHNSAALQVYLYPQLYRLIEGITEADNIYVEIQDKHNWIFASEVELIRAYVLKRATRS